MSPLGGKREYQTLRVQMIRVVRVLAGIPPGNMHFTGSQVDHHGIYGLLAVERVIDIHGMIADGVREVDVVALDGLQGLDRVLVLALDQPHGAEVAHA